MNYKNKDDNKIVKAYEFTGHEINKNIITNVIKDFSNCADHKYGLIGTNDYLGIKAILILIYHNNDLIIITEGDYIVLDNEGNLEGITRRIFERKYELVSNVIGFVV